MSEKKEWVLVDCVSTFRMRYLVEVPEGKKEWALDTVVMKEAKEFSQEHIGEQIVSHRVVTKEEALAICDEDNSYCASWNDEQKEQAFFTHEGEKVEL
jgi:adenosyl cobinamide kinase/adenosyl cobinamide phosphate guanylyltransferase